MSEEKKVVNAVVKQEKLEDIIAYLRSVPVTDPISAICAPIVHALADRIEAAWKLQMSQSWHHREMTELVMRHEKEVMELKKRIPNPDPDWKAICEKCHDGDLEPDCEYYGEPNGCNSPIYGEHPKAKPVCNAAAMREALEAVVKEHSGGTMDKEDICRACSTKICGKCKHNGTCWVDRAFVALSKPARNCDMFGGDYVMLHTVWFDWTGAPSGHLPDGTVKMTFAEWLLAPAAERKGEGDGR